MAEFTSDVLGKLDDRVRLTLGDEDVLIAENYEVKSSILTQPAAWSLRLGNGNVARDILQKYRPTDPVMAKKVGLAKFELHIGNVLQQTGRIDDVIAEGSTGATEITIRGRDSLAPLHDDFIAAEQSFTDSTYEQLVRAQLRAVGLGASQIDGSNAASRKIKAGVPIVELGPPRTVDEIIQDAGVTGTIHQQINAKLGERRYELTKRYLDRAGLFLWAGPDGRFVLSEPNSKQDAIYRIIRGRGQERNEVNVIDAHYENCTTQRFTEVIVFGRGGGKKFGRSKIHGGFVDDEMFNLGITRRRTYHDTTVTNIQQAEFYARRKIAEANRASWKLVYTLAGHTAPAIGGGGRAVWTPDTMVNVVDEEFGLEGNFWVEATEHRRNPQTTTTITLTKPSYLVFGSDEFE